jgi:hypothetical protein
VKVDSFLERAEQLIRQADAVLRTEPKTRTTGHVDFGSMSGFRAASLSFLNNVFADSHPYYRDFDARCRNAEIRDVQSGRAILVAVAAELRGGWFVTARGLLSAEVFQDFLGMAAHLLEQSYKDPAAVLTGSVLEEHLRQLCLKHGISSTLLKGGVAVPKKADVLNAELAGGGVYNLLDQKSVTAWLDLRNKAAHGRYTEYVHQQVELMMQGVTDFMTRNPA